MARIHAADRPGHTTKSDADDWSEPAQAPEEDEIVNYGDNIAQQTHIDSLEESSLSFSQEIIVAARSSLGGHKWGTLGGRRGHGINAKETVIDLGYRGADAANPGGLIKHRGWIRSMNDKERRQLKRRQAV